MRSSILIAFFVVAISSSTYGVGSIFGITINPDNLHTLSPGQVEEEIKANLGLVQQIDELFEKVPSNQRAWLNEFKKMVTDEREMIAKLQIPLSQINPDDLQCISEENSRYNIPDDVFQKIHKVLRDYFKLLKFFELNHFVWIERLLWSNPFEQFLDRIRAANLEGSKVSTIENAFKEAAKEVATAKEAIVAIMSNLAEALKPQYEESKNVMDELRRLNDLVGSSDDKNVKKSAIKLKELLINLILKVAEVTYPKRAIISKQLIQIERAHIVLNKQLEQV